MAYRRGIRQSIRLRGYDYSKIGTYFVTICTQNRECVFGRVVNEKIALNSMGAMVMETWIQIPENYPDIITDEFIIMPNHIHGIIIMNHEPVGAGPRACPSHVEKSTHHNYETTGTNKNGQPQGVAPTFSLPDVVHRLKSLTTAKYRKMMQENSCPPYPRRLWQRNYYEHIIRNEGDLYKIREYIRNNPMNWEMDENHPARFKSSPSSAR